MVSISRAARQVMRRPDDMMLTKTNAIGFLYLLTFSFLCYFHPAKNSSSIAKINQDFDSQILQNEWNKYRSSHLERHQQRSQSYTDLETEIHAQQMTFRENANIVHTKLNDIIDTNKARLADAEVEVGYEINRLYDKFGAGPTGTKGGECLDVRADLTRCYTTLKDSNECQIFVQKLDRCVTDALRN